VFVEPPARPPPAATGGAARERGHARRGRRGREGSASQGCRSVPGASYMLGAGPRRRGQVCANKEAAPVVIPTCLGGSSSDGARNSVIAQGVLQEGRREGPNVEDLRRGAD